MTSIRLEELGNYTLFHEDCLLTTKKFPSSSIDLIYADPPFFTGKSHSREGCSFNDKWKNPQEYLDWIHPRFEEFKRVLKPSGSIYIHCDWHISHYLKVLADDIFGRNNFLNEIIWKRQSSHNDAQQGSRHFGRIHDSILVYVESKNYIWNQQYSPYDDAYVKRTYRYTESFTLRRYALGDLTGPGGKAKGNPKYDFLGIERYWRYSRTKMSEMLSSGRIAHKKGKVPLLKRYLDEMKGKPLQDIWADVTIDREEKRFPTQKPKELLNRIVVTSSNPQQVVFEPFAGSATAGIVCYKLSRRWIGSEVSLKACLFSLHRLQEAGCNVRLLSNQISPLEPLPVIT